MFPKTLIWTLLLGFLCSSAWADEPLELALFEEIPIVFSASRIEEPIDEAPAAIQVITGEQLKAWGIQDLPDAFRYVPGLDVVAFNGREWGVTARGFNERLARRMLVLVDGMSVYTPLFSGVPWHSLPVFIEDIERIEIIRGPNDTLYGFNAFNGVINILTKAPEKTKGALTRYTTGSHGRHDVLQRFSGDVPDQDIDYRVSYSFLRTDGYGDNNGDQFEDDRRLQRFNARSAWKASDQTEVEFLVGLSNGPQDQGPVSTTGLFADSFQRRHTFDSQQMILKHSWSDAHKSKLQLYRWGYNQDAKVISDGLSVRDHREQQYDVELEDTWTTLEGRSQTVWGASFRHNRVNSFLVRHHHPPRQRQTTTDNLYSVFINEKYALVRDEEGVNQLSVVGGLRLEKSQLIEDVEVAPRVSLLFSPKQNHRFRLTYARAFRLPSFLEEYFTSFTPTLTGATQQLLGNPNLETEKVDSFEIGYATDLLDKKLKVNADAFYADYADLIRLVDDPTAAVTTSTFDQAVDAESFGAELGLEYAWTPWLTSFGNYTFIHIDDNQNSAIARRFEDAAPKHKATLGLRASIDDALAEELDSSWLGETTWDVRMRYRDAYVDYAENGFVLDVFKIKPNVAMDISASKRFWDDALEVGVTVQNLVGADHFEARFVEVPRLYFVSVSVKDAARIWEQLCSKKYAAGESDA